MGTENVFLFAHLCSYPLTSAQRLEKSSQLLRTIFFFLIATGILLWACPLWAQEALPVPEFKVVVIDPGHGGKDYGIVLNKGTLIEKDFMLSLAKELRDQLKQHSDLQVYLTRESDVNLSILERATLANRKQADVFISLHMMHPRNALAKAQARIYYQQVIADEKPTRVSTPAVPTDLKLIPWYSAQKQMIPASQKLAKSVQQDWKLKSRFKVKDHRAMLHSAGLALLVGIHSAAVLIELPLESLASPLGGQDRSSRHAAVQSLNDGILAYLF